MTQYKENICPAFRADTSNLALTELLITWEMCDCEEAAFSHLVEVRWHRDCFVERIAELTITTLAPILTTVEGDVCQN